MVQYRTIQRSFAGGEMSPHMLARVDDIKFQNGYKSGKNLLVTSTGSLVRRPGLAHDARAKFNDKVHRLIPFVYSVDLALQIELGNLYFRFHQNGAPVRYAAPLQVAAIDTDPGDETITFTERHFFIADDQIQFTAASGTNAHIPGGLTAGTTYFVQVVDAKTIKVHSSAGGASLVNLTSAGTGVIYAWRNTDMPADWSTLTHTFNPADVNTTTNSITEIGHGFVAGQPVRFSSTGTLPAPLVAGRNYYVRLDGPDAYGVTDDPRPEAATLPGFDLNLATQGTGVHTVRKVYLHGEMVYRTGATSHGVLRTRVDVEANVEPFSDLTNWMLQPVTGEIEVENPYLEADLMEIGHDQENNVVTLVHEDYTAAELRFYGGDRWTYTLLSFVPLLEAPGGLDIDPVFGDYIAFTNNTATPTLFTTTSGAAHAFVIGDSVFAEKNPGQGNSFGGQAAGYYIVTLTGNVTPGAPHNDLRLGTVNGRSAIGGLSADSCVIRFSSLSSESSSSYRITAATAEDNESLPSAVITQANNDLSVSGSYNLVKWATVPGAAYYNVYKLLNGLYGFLGKVDAGGAVEDASFGGLQLSFKDDNSLIPDLDRTLPILDTTLGGSATRNPRAVTHFEQRRFFAGTIDEPQGVWATRSATETDLHFHLPVKDDDRLQFELKSREAVSIRHLVPLEQLVVLSNSTEFRVIPVNSDVLTPSSIDAKTHDYVGVARVKPSVLSGNVVFAGARGGHVYEMGYRQDGLGLAKPGDLCLRSNHLFDNKTLTDQIAVKAPQPLILFRSSTGQLLALTYVPQESIGAWQVLVDGTAIESVSAIPEGGEDRVYVSTRRTVNGSTVRSIERMGLQQFQSLRESFHVDAGGTYDGRNTTAYQMTVTGSSFLAGATVTVTGSATPAQFVLGSGDVGDEVVLWEASAPTTLYRIRITSVTTPTQVLGVLRDDLPLALQATATTAWGLARDTISVPHLEGATVEILADGLQHSDEVVASGLITLDSPALIVQVGLSAQGELQTLPLAMQVEALGQGRPKNVNRTWFRVVDSGAFEIGPNTAEMVPANPEAVAGTVVTQEVDTTVMPEYTQGGELVIRTSGSLPLTILGVVTECEVGG